MEAAEEVRVAVPLVVRLDGTNAEEGKKMLAEATSIWRWRTRCGKEQIGRSVGGRTISVLVGKFQSSRVSPGRRAPSTPTSALHMGRTSWAA
jgi:hypothetical protein